MQSVIDLSVTKIVILGVVESQAKCRVSVLSAHQIS